MSNEIIDGETGETLDDMVVRDCPDWRGKNLTIVHVEPRWFLTDQTADGDTWVSAERDGIIRLEDAL